MKPKTSPRASPPLGISSLYAFLKCRPQAFVFDGRTQILSNHEDVKKYSVLMRFELWLTKNILSQVLTMASETSPVQDDIYQQGSDKQNQLTVLGLDSCEEQCNPNLSLMYCNMQCRSYMYFLLD